ncbi:hypothetical protein B0H16DRAFT_1738812 [Mycena metata]|uniref:Uncharacterized protein n=1 Tax=Mycena metata TaxID=1033252 RepID=A0AAD7HGZ5_9AGAR|nr:hypothetical protein B0H16DRAFT_1738812 [Mycena metata]
MVKGGGHGNGAGGGEDLRGEVEVRFEWRRFPLPLTLDFNSPSPFPTSHPPHPRLRRRACTPANAHRPELPGAAVRYDAASRICGCVTRAIPHLPRPRPRPRRPVVHTSARTPSHPPRLPPPSFSTPPPSRNKRTNAVQLAPLCLFPTALFYPRAHAHRRNRPRRGCICPPMRMPCAMRVDVPACRWYANRPVPAIFPPPRSIHSSHSSLVHLLFALTASCAHAVSLRVCAAFRAECRTRAIVFDGVECSATEAHSALQILDFIAFRLVQPPQTESPCRLASELPGDFEAASLRGNTPSGVSHGCMLSHAHILRRQTKILASSIVRLSAVHPPRRHHFPLLNTQPQPVGEGMRERSTVHSNTLVRISVIRKLAQSWRSHGTCCARGD